MEVLEARGIEAQRAMYDVVEVAADVGTLDAGGFGFQVGHLPEHARFPIALAVAPGVRRTNELAYHDYIENELSDHEFFGEWVRKKRIYYPTVTREAFRNEGRLTELVETGKLFDDIGESPLDPATDRTMICGSSAMLKDTAALLDARGFTVSPRLGEQGYYVIERAFAEK